VCALVMVLIFLVGMDAKHVGEELQIGRTNIPFVELNKKWEGSFHQFETEPGLMVVIKIGRKRVVDTAHNKKIDVSLLITANLIFHFVPVYREAVIRLPQPGDIWETLLGKQSERERIERFSPYFTRFASLHLNRKRTVSTSKLLCRNRAPFEGYEPRMHRYVDGWCVSNILQFKGYVDSGSMLREMRRLIGHFDVNFNPSPMTCDQTSCGNIGTVACCIGSHFGSFDRPSQMASVDQRYAPEPISSEPQSQRENGYEYGRDSSQPFGGYLGEHRNPLKDDAIFGGAFIIGGVIFLVLMAFGIRELITGRNEERYFISDSEEQKECAKDERDPTKSKSSAKPR
jgi:hypothetical protein